jgi:hypothetical protein
MGQRKSRELLKGQRTFYWPDGTNFKQPAVVCPDHNVENGNLTRPASADLQHVDSERGLRFRMRERSMVLANRIAGARSVASQLFFQQHKREHGLCHHTLERIE